MDVGKPYLQDYGRVARQPGASAIISYYPISRYGVAERS